MSNVDEIYQRKCEIKSDINEHLPTLKKYAEECDSVVEMGVRAIVSTYAFLAARPKTLISIDKYNPSHFSGDLNSVKNIASQIDIDFEFIRGGTRQIEIDECDLLFIDTWHVYEQLKIELDKHGNKAQKYIAFHDTTLFEYDGEGKGYKGLWPAIEEFLQQNPHWKLKERFYNNNGLTILERNS